MKTELKKTIRITSAILTSLLVITTVSGCSLKKDPVATAPKVITIWGFESEDLWQPVLKDPNFQKSISGFEVKYVKKTLTDSYENDALNSILSGQGPDVWAIPNDWVYRHKDKLVPAPADLAKNYNLGNNFVPSVLENNIIDNQVYGYSPGIDTIMLYYNPKLLEQSSGDYNKFRPVKSQDEDSEHYRARADVIAFNQTMQLIGQPPKTWSNFLEAVKLITKKDGNNFTVSGFAAGTTSNVSYATDIIYSLMLQNKVKMTSDDLKLATFNLPINTASGESDISGKYVLDFYTQFANPASPYYSWNRSIENNLDAFANGKVAYILAPGSTSAYFSQKYPNFVYKNALIPQISEAQGEDIAYGRTYSYVVPALSRFPSQAWTVTLAASLNNANQESSRIYKDFPSVKNDKIRLYQANVSHIWIKGRYPKEVDQIFKTAIDNVQDGLQSSENSINTAATKVTELLRKSEW